MSETGSRHTLRAANERIARAKLAYENPGIDFVLYHREPAEDETPIPAGPDYGGDAA